MQQSIYIAPLKAEHSAAIWEVGHSTDCFVDFDSHDVLTHAGKTFIRLYRRSTLRNYLFKLTDFRD